MTPSLSAELWPDVSPDAARRLMLAGVESFARRGFHATTTRDIAAGAGMSAAALYVHFPSKGALLFAISRSGHEQTLRLTEAAIARGADPVAAVRELVGDFVAWHARRHTVARVVQYELHALSADEFATIAALRRRIERAVREVVVEGVTAGAFRVEDPATAARALLSLGIDVARWYTDRSRTAPATLGRQYAELAVRMLGATVA